MTPPTLVPCETVPWNIFRILKFHVLRILLLCGEEREIEEIAFLGLHSPVL